MNNEESLLITVIIPSYNHGKYLGRALQSLLDQTYTNWEVIIIDNHSTDHTESVIKSFSDSRIKFLKIKNNGIVAASRNAGIRSARGTWVAFLDADDWWTKDKLTISMSHANQNVDLIYHYVETINKKSNFPRSKIIKSKKLKKPILVNLLISGNTIVNSSVVVRKALLEKIGGISEKKELVAAEDYHTWLRIAQFTDQFFCIPRRLGYYLCHDNNLSAKDMSLPSYHAVADFISVLNKQQKIRLNANFSYISARFNYLDNNYTEVNKKLLYALCNGRLILKIRATALFFLVLKRKLIGL